jgi:hypothetical protein
MEITMDKSKVKTSEPTSLADKLRKKLVVHRVKKELTVSKKQELEKKRLKQELERLKKEFKKKAQKAIDDNDNFLDFNLYSWYMNITDNRPYQARHDDFVVDSFKPEYPYQQFIDWLGKEGFSIDYGRHWTYDPDDSDYRYYMRVSW